MSQNNKEHEETTEQAASMTTAGGSDSLVIIKRTHQDIDEFKKLKFIRAVNLGLTIGRAARMV